MGYVKAVFAYLFARLSEGSTEAALVAVASALGAAYAGEITWPAAGVAAVVALAPALVPDGARPVVVKILGALLKGAGKTAPMLALLSLLGTGWLLVACAAVDAAKTGQPLDRAQMQQDLASAVYLLQATGCAVAGAGAAAAPIVSISADAEGQQVLQAVDAAGAILCRLVVPPTALPVPAPANAAPATAPAAAS